METTVQKNKASNDVLKTSVPRGLAISLRGFIGPAIVIVLAMIVIPALAGSFWLKAFTSSVIFSLAALGAALLYGRLGLVSLGQIAQLGMGGWVVLRLGHGTDLPFGIVLLIGGIVA